jgi:hypothetical protein
MTPHVARCAEAVQHDHCRAMTADPHMDGCTVGFDLMRLHRSREGMDTIPMSVIVHRFTPNLKGTQSRKDTASKTATDWRPMAVSVCVVLDYAAGTKV